jgi:hypothetical protein
VPPGPDFELPRAVLDFFAGFSAEVEAIFFFPLPNIVGYGEF